MYLNCRDKMQLWCVYVCRSNEVVPLNALRFYRIIIGCIECIWHSSITFRYNRHFIGIADGRIHRLRRFGRLFSHHIMWITRNNPRTLINTIRLILPILHKVLKIDSGFTLFVFFFFWLLLLSCVDELVVKKISYFKKIFSIYLCIWFIFSCKEKQNNFNR